MAIATRSRKREKFSNNNSIHNNNDKIHNNLNHNKRYPKNEDNDHVNITP